MNIYNQRIMKFLGGNPPKIIDSELSEYKFEKSYNKYTFELYSFLLEDRIAVSLKHSDFNHYLYHLIIESVKNIELHDQSNNLKITTYDSNNEYYITSSPYYLLTINYE